mmetsp:Transcript_23871/g.54347  ORF Transcript_23871/g.54347 Transcript_23871/m.54347 type:complete len:80 (+) Transcript_23871:35-274(+)
MATAPLSTSILAERTILFIFDAQAMRCLGGGWLVGVLGPTAGIQQLQNGSKLLQVQGGQRRRAGCCCGWLSLGLARVQG